jgi:glycosyltransferase involved in cell wall biosynthesis
MHEKKPLVSIIVCTYNSSEYILEALESAKKQTYKNIELIISDDASKDNTVEICRQWLLKNKDRFVRIELLMVEKNTGVVRNANRSFNAARGQWIKFLPADDILLENCITSNIDFINNSNNNISFLFTRFKFLVGNKFVTEHRRINYFNNNEKVFRKSARGQFFSLVKDLFVCPPTVFIKTNTLHDLGGFDEEFEITDDFPLFLKATSNGIKFYLNPVVTTIYRFHESSLSEKNYKQWVYLDEKIVMKYFKLKYRIFFPLQYLDFKITIWNKKRVIEGKKSYGKLSKLINPLALLRFVQNRTGR